MVICNTTIVVEDSVSSEWEIWMKTHYIQLLKETGCFSNVYLMSVMLDDPQHNKTYALMMHCKDMNTYELFEKKFAARLDGLHISKFNGKFGSFRTLLEEL